MGDARGKWLAASFRLLFGVALLGAAAASAFPTALPVLGVVSRPSGAAVLILNDERDLALVEWWARRPAVQRRAWSAAALAFAALAACCGDAMLCPAAQVGACCCRGKPAESSDRMARAACPALNRRAMQDQGAGGAR